MNRFSLICVVFCALLLFSCDINPVNHHKLSKTLVKAKPADGGALALNDSLLTAKAKPGYTFLYWKVYQKDGSFITLTEYSTAVKNIEKVKNVIGVFGKNRLQISAHLSADPGGRYAYYLIGYSMPVDSADGKYLNAIVRVDLKENSKQKVYITDDKIYRFDVSFDGKKIAFSIYDQSGQLSYTTKILNLSTHTVERVGRGSNPIWANHSYKLLVGRPTGACVYDLLTNRCLELKLNNGSLIKDGFWAAAWSPDDKKIALSRETKYFYIFNFTGSQVQRTKIKSRTPQGPKDYFVWLNNNTFFTSGKTFYHPIRREVISYTLGNLNSPKILPFKAGYEISVSPKNNKVAYINSGLKAYNINTGQIKFLIKNNRIEGAGRPIWMKNGRILFVDITNAYMPYVIEPSGEVRKL